MDTLNNRSWVDEMDDENSHHSKVFIQTPEKGEKQTDTLCNSSRRKIFFVKDENGCDAFSQNTNDGADIISPKTTSSYANILKSSPDANSCKLPVSDATPKKEAGKDFLQEDISLSSHLDVFHVESPCKGKVNTEVVDKDEFPELSPWSRKMKHPSKKSHTENNDCKDEVLKQTGRIENCADQNSDPVSRRRTVDAQDAKGRRLPPDDVLMPSPSKITRQSNRITENSPAASRTPRTPRNEFRKRQREFSSPASGGSSRNKYETDPAVLARRQKQIDYGKNTVGYDTYIASVPKKERGKNHPQTPPMHLKYSRRAWDGLVKIWRKRLHFWDPPSEGGGDPALLEDDESSIGDMSLDMSSVVSTPQQESKRRRGLDRDETKRAINNGGSGGAMDDDDDDEECKPLPIEDWILMGEGEPPEEDHEIQNQDDGEVKNEIQDQDDGEVKNEIQDEDNVEIKLECP